ncbi:MAG: class I SAM-dependent methyltransferase [Chloroflexota bacterium]
MPEEHVWKQFFDQHAGRYMDEPFVTATVAEVDFLIEHLHLTPSMHVLDMGCGTGRHAIELARRGCRVTGVDISEGMLAEARRTAEAAGVTGVTFQQADATTYTAPTSFDCAYCVCEGSLGLIGSGEDPYEHDAAVLRNLYDAIRPGGRVVITALNAMRCIRQYQQADVEAGIFDPMTLTETNTMETEGPAGSVTVTVRERGMVPPELRLLLRVTGFTVEHIGGGTAGDWGLRPAQLDEFELLAIVSKPA